MELVISITVFVLAAFVGFEVITKVPPTLHTPLMSGVERDFWCHDHRRTHRRRKGRQHAW